MIRNTVTQAAEAAAETVDPAELVTLAELASEGFGPWSNHYTQGPRDVIRGLAAQLADEVVTDDIGRLAVPKDTARRLFVARDEAERRQREQQERWQAEIAERAAREPLRGGVPVPEGYEDADALTVLRLADSKVKRGELDYHPMPDPDEPRVAGELYQYGPPR